MVTIDIVTMVIVDNAEPAKITLKQTHTAEVEYTFNKKLPGNSNCEIWVRAGTKEKLKLLTIKAACKVKPAKSEPEKQGEQWEKCYPRAGSCPGLSFKALHKLHDGQTRYSDAIYLTDDRYFDPHTSSQLFSNDVEELEAIVFDNNSNVTVDNIEVFVARDG